MHYTATISESHLNRLGKRMKIASRIHLEYFQNIYLGPQSVRPTKKSRLLSLYSRALACTYCSVETRRSVFLGP